MVAGRTYFILFHLLLISPFIGAAFLEWYKNGHRFIAPGLLCWYALALCALIPLLIDVIIGTPESPFVKSIFFGCIVLTLPLMMVTTILFFGTSWMSGTAMLILTLVSGGILMMGPYIGAVAVFLEAIAGKAR